MSDQNKNPTEILGYFIIIFQTTFTGYVKCWIDGDPDYVYMSEEEFIDLFFKIKAPLQLILEAQDDLSTSSIYIWDIYEGRINRLNGKTKEKPLREAINEMNPLKQEKKQSIREISIFKNFFKRENKGLY